MPKTPAPDIDGYVKTGPCGGYSEEALRAYGEAVREECAKACDAVYAEEQQEPVCYGIARECAEAIRQKEE